MREARYSRDEVTAILRRAAEMEGDHGGGSQASELSLAEVERIAADSGLNLDLVRAAARELTETVGTPQSGFHLHQLRSLAGELDEQQLEELVNSVGTKFRLPGQTTRTRDRWEWVERWGHRRLSVTAEARGGRTIIELKEDLRGLAKWIYGGAITGVGIPGFLLGLILGENLQESPAAPLVFTFVMLAALGVGYGIGRLLFRRHRLVRDVQLQQLATEIDEQGRESLGQAAVPEEPTPETGEAESVPSSLHRELKTDAPRDQSKAHRQQQKGRRSRS